jgi:hypothetical protein
LREEKGGREESDGGNTAAQPQGPTVGTNRGPTAADVAVSDIILHTTNSNPSQPAIMTRQDQSLAINANLAHTQPTPHQNAPANNAPANKFQINPSFQSLLARFSQENPPAFIAADSIQSQFPTINIPPGNISDLPLITSQPETEILKAKLLPNQSFTFNSQSTINSQQNKNLSQTKQLTGPNPNPFDPMPLLKPVTDPKLTRPKKPKTYPKKPNPTQNPSKPEKSQAEQEDMVTHSEKKRRRREVTCTNNSSTTEASKHFLTAGPGSQACRDQ